MSRPSLGETTSCIKNEISSSLFLKLMRCERSDQIKNKNCVALLLCTFFQAYSLPDRFICVLKISIYYYR